MYSNYNYYVVAEKIKRFTQFVHANISFYFLYYYLYIDRLLNALLNSMNRFYIDKNAFNPYFKLLFMYHHQQNK